MPRIKQLESQYLQSDLLREIRVRRAFLDIPRDQDLADMTGIPLSTLWGKLKEPEKMTVLQLRKIIRALALDPEIVLRFLGYDGAQIKKLKENKTAS